MLKQKLIVFLVSQLIGNVINLEMSQQPNDERDYENETAMKIDETMVNLRQSTFEPDAELIMMSSQSDDEIKRKKRQADENSPNEAPEDNPNENEPTISETFTIATDDQTDDEPSVNLEVETSITKGPTTTFIGGIPLSLITRPNTTTSTTMTTTITTTTKSIAIKGKVTYYTKKPIIFPSETTTKFTVGSLVRQQATGLTSTSHKAGMVAPMVKNMKIVSTTKKVTTKKVQKKVEGTKMVTKKMTKTTLKAKMSTNSTAKTTVKGLANAKKIG